MTGDRLRTALRGVRGFVLDADGVLVLKSAVLPGSMEAVAALTARGIPFRVVTNFSTLHRETLAGFFARGGLTIDPDRIITGTSAAAAYTATRHPGRPLFVLAAPDAMREFSQATDLAGKQAPLKKWLDQYEEGAKKALKQGKPPRKIAGKAKEQKKDWDSLCDAAAECIRAMAEESFAKMKPPVTPDTPLRNPWPATDAQRAAAKAASSAARGGGAV